MFLVTLRFLLHKEREFGDREAGGSESKVRIYLSKNTSPREGRPTGEEMLPPNRGSAAF